MDLNQAFLEGKDWPYRSIFDAAIDGLIILDLEIGHVFEANPAACSMHGYPRAGFIGLKMTGFIHPDSQHLFREYIQVFQSDGEFEALVQHIRKDGTMFTAEWRGTAFTYQGRSCLVGIVRDVSKRIEAEQSLKQHVEMRTLEQARLLEISLTLASTLEFQPGLILDQLREIVAYTHAGLFALEDSTLVTQAMRGMLRFTQSAPIRINIHGAETLATLFNGHRPIRIADVRSDNPHAQFLRTLLADGADVLLEGMRSWMWVPLAVKGRIIGGLGVAHEKRNYFTSHHADLALSVANLAALTLINAELYKNAQTLAVFEERQRLARNLHDAINQSLFSAGLIAEVLPRLWERDQTEARRSILDLLRLMRGAQAEMRALLAELRPSTLIDSNLGDLLHLLGNALSGRTDISTTITSLDDCVLPPDVQITFYRICQEALFNVAKHSKAKQVEIILKRVDATIEMCIRDDGLGFDPSHTISGHYGLDMMRERATAVGALLALQSQPGHGTELTMRWTEPPPKEVV